MFFVCIYIYIYNSCRGRGPGQPPVPWALKYDIDFGPCGHLRIHIYVCVLFIGQSKNLNLYREEAPCGVCVWMNLELLAVGSSPEAPRVYAGLSSSRLSLSISLPLTLTLSLLRLTLSPADMGWQWKLSTVVIVLWGCSFLFLTRARAGQNLVKLHTRQCVVRISFLG